MGRHNLSSGAKWEPVVGYSRAVRVGNTVYISGTVAINDGGEVVYPGNSGEQARFILKKIKAVLESAGAELADVVRTRIFVLNIDDWEAVGLAHGECFGDIRPATTMVEVRRLIAPGLMVEIEAEAVIET